MLAHNQIALFFDFQTEWGRRRISRGKVSGIDGSLVLVAKPARQARDLGLRSG
jgi:hypothetical protein